MSEDDETGREDEYDDEEDDLDEDEDDLEEDDDADEDVDRRDDEALTGRRPPRRSFAREDDASSLSRTGSGGRPAGGRRR